MNTVRAAQVTKSGNPLSNKSLVELTPRVMPPATEVIEFTIPFLDDGVAS
jgi:hypothetical protein